MTLMHKAQILSDRHLRAWQAAYLILMSAVLYFFTSGWVYDDPYITYRYAANLRDGVGFVYNPGERVLSTTTPLFAMLLAVLSRLWDDIPRLAVLVGCISLAAGGLALFDLAHSYRATAPGWILLLLYPLFPLLTLTLSSETPLYLALILISFAAYERKKYLLVGLCAALAGLARPDGILVPAILGAHFLFLRREPIPWKAVLLFLALTLAWVGFAQWYFGSPLPVTLAAKQHQGQMAAGQTFLPGIGRVAGWYAGNPGYQAMLGLAAVGLAGFWKANRDWWLLLGWTVAYFVGYSILGVTAYFWYYAPLVPGLVVLAAIGITTVGQAARWALNRMGGARLALLAWVLPVLIALTLWAVETRSLLHAYQSTDARMAVYRQAGEWLRANAAPGARIGALEIGAIGYYAQRPVVDFAGLIQPDIAAQLSPTTTYEDAAFYAIQRYRPAFVVLIPGVFARLESSDLLQRCRKAQSFSDRAFQVDLYDCR